jgi:hypothetical protein
MFRLLVDFNEIQDGVVRGLPEDAEGLGDPSEGDRLLLHDDGEHEAFGTVERLENDLIYAKIDWSSFGPAGRPLIVTRYEEARPINSNVGGVRAHERQVVVA